MSKKEPYKEPELMINGEQVKFHYSRKERLAMGHDNPNVEKNCFFCKKNRHVLFLLADFLLIFMIIIGYYYIVGKSKGIVRDNFYYNLSNRRGPYKDSTKFIIQIKNMLKKENNLSYKDYSIEIYDNTNNFVTSQIITLDKIQYEPKEFNTYEIDFSGISPGKYTGILKNSSGKLIELNFRVR